MAIGCIYGRRQGENRPSHSGLWPFSLTLSQCASSWCLLCHQVVICPLLEDLHTNIDRFPASVTCLLQVPNLMWGHVQGVSVCQAVRSTQVVTREKLDAGRCRFGFIQLPTAPYTSLSLYTQSKEAAKNPWAESGGSCLNLCLLATAAFLVRSTAVFGTPVRRRARLKIMGLDIFCPI